jgi:hypothetical protein
MTTVSRAAQINGKISVAIFSGTPKSVFGPTSPLPGITNVA